MNIHSKIFFDKLLNYKNIILCVNDREKCRSATKELKKCNHEYVQDYLHSKICSFPSKTFYNNYVSHISVLIGICQVLTIQLAHASETAPTQPATQGQSSTEKTQENSDGFSFSNITEYLQKGFQCISGNNKDYPNCVQRIFLVLSLAGTFLSLIGAVFSLLYRFCSCFMCCRRSPRPKPTNQVNNNNQQLDLMQMQMQMQQQQMCNALMGATLANKGKMNKGNKKSKKEKGNKKGRSEKKNRNSSNGTNKPRSKNSRDKQIHIGYQKYNE